MNYALVGLFVILLGGALVASVLWLASGGAWQKRVDLYLAVMDESVAGLNLNAPVKYSGVDVGRVREIHLDPANPERVTLLFALDHGTPVTEGTVAVLKVQGLTGIAYVELSGSTYDGKRLLATPGQPYPVIPTKPSLTARLENVLSTVLVKIDSTSSSINAILSDENKAAFASALEDIAEVARTIAARKATLDAGMADAARTFASGARALEQAAPVIERIGRSADALAKMGDEMALAGAGAGKTVEAAGRTFEAAGSTFEAVGSDVKRFTGETLPELERLMGELSVLAVSLRRLSEQTERDPRGLLFGRKAVPAGPGETKPTP